MLLSVLSLCWFLPSESSTPTQSGSVSRATLCGCSETLLIARRGATRAQCHRGCFAATCSSSPAYAATRHVSTKPASSSRNGRIPMAI